jgi:hypothetical protein
MLRDHAIALAREIDAVEADLRRLEARLSRIRERLAKQHDLRPGEYGFVDDGASHAAREEPPA